MKLAKFAGILCMLVLFACNSNTETKDQFTVLEEAASSDPTPENLKDLFNAYGKFVNENKEDPEVHKTIDRAYDMAMKLQRPGTATGFLMSSIKLTEDTEVRKSKLIQLASQMANLKRNNASAALYYGILKAYPSSEEANEIRTNLPQDYENIDQYIQKLAADVFENPDPAGFNRNAALKYVDACEAYALSLPNDTLAPKYLYRASEMSTTLGTTSKTLSLYDWLIDHYPSFEKTANALFLKAYTLDNESKNGENMDEQKQLVKGFYEEFLQKYPEHQLAPSAKFLLENLGKSDAEIYELITKNKSEEESD